MWSSTAAIAISRDFYPFINAKFSFVILDKDNTRYTRVTLYGVDKSTGLRSDQSILLITPKSTLAYPDRLRRVSYRDPDTDKFLVFLTDRFDLPALTIADIYRNR